MKKPVSSEGGESAIGGARKNKCLLVNNMTIQTRDKLYSKDKDKLFWKDKEINSSKTWSA